MNDCSFSGEECIGRNSSADQGSAMPISDGTQLFYIPGTALKRRIFLFRLRRILIRICELQVDSSRLEPWKNVHPSSTFSLIPGGLVRCFNNSLQHGTFPARKYTVTVPPGY